VLDAQYTQTDEMLFIFFSSISFYS
jgi:hypothetical protein